MRTMTLLFCFGLGAQLAGCAGANAAHEVAAPLAEPAAASEAAPAPAPTRTAANTKRGKKDDAHAEGDKEIWWKDGGVTREKINAMCWMKYENGRKDLPIDKRADLVNDCVIKTLKEHPIQ